MKIKIPKWLHNLLTYIFLTGGVIQFSKDFTLTQEVGSRAATVMVNHGVTQPILGAIILFIFMLLMYLYMERVKKEAVTSTPQPDPEYERVVNKFKAFSRKYGENWMDRIEGTLNTLSQIGTKKK